MSFPLDYKGLILGGYNLICAMRILRYILTSTALLAACSTLYAQKGDSLLFSLELFQRTRGEVHAGYRELRSNRPAAVFLSQRTQVGMGIKYHVFESYINLQDGRIWGATPNQVETGLLESWIQISNSHSDAFRSIRMGRQVIQLDDAWLFMARRYAKTGLAHDAIRIHWQQTRYALDLYTMCNALNEKNSRLEYYEPHYYKYMFIVHGDYNLSPRNSIGGIVVGDWNQEKESPTYLYGRFTGGLLLNLRPASNVQFKAELYYQGGNTYSLQYGKAMTVSAFSVHSRLFLHGTTTGAFGLDWISGGTQAELSNGKLHQFDRLSGTSHSFFGYMDYFTLQLPTLGGLGLRDYNAWLYTPKEKNMQVELSVHAFQTDKRPEGLDSFLGVEFDLKGMVDFYTNMRLEFVYGYFYGTNSLVALQGGNVKHHGHFGYLSFQYVPHFTLKLPTTSQP